MKIIKTVTIIFCLLNFIQCKTLQFEKNPPFKIQTANYNYIVGGVAGANSINLNISYTSSNKIDFKDVYFLKRKTKAFTEVYGKEKKITATFNLSTINNREDLILSENTTKEINNQLPEIKSKFPFELKENEAVISYLKANKVYYLKVNNLRKGKSIFMP